jgi:hypothetical protein
MLHHGMAACIVSHLEDFITSMAFIFGVASDIRSKYLKVVGSEADIRSSASLINKKKVKLSL